MAVKIRERNGKWGLFVDHRRPLHPDPRALVLRRAAALERGRTRLESSMDGLHALGPQTRAGNRPSTQKRLTAPDTTSSLEKSIRCH
jgi:hypothetical protein